LLLIKKIKPIAIIIPPIKTLEATPSLNKTKARIDAIMGSPSGIDAIIVGDTNFIE
tara:strand:- start:237 stop:404 length:168 start_codon:yes stop_codon:yes gene_type:complete